MADTNTITRDLHNFTRIDLRGAGHIHLAQDADFSFDITAENHILDLIETFVEDDTLVIRFVEGTKRVQTDKKIEYHITMPVIGGVKISGGGSLQCERIAGKSFKLNLPGGSTVTIGSIAVADFVLGVQGGSKVTMDSVQTGTATMNIPGSLNMTLGELNADQLNMTVQGTANINIAGRVISQTLDVLGVVNIKAEKLQSDHAKVKSLGMSNITLWVYETLDAIISGAGNIKYYGDPNVKKSVSGFGKVKRLGMSPAQVV
ncbi:MAG: head GIN domain-containing protein [Chloroflexota bacterium]